METPSSHFLTPIQKRIVAAALTCLATLLLFACFTVVFVVLRNAIGLFSSVIWPLAIAFILSMLLKPAVNLFAAYLHLQRTKSILLLYSLVFIGCVTLLALVAPTILGQIIDLIHFLPHFFQDIYASVKSHYPRVIEFTQNYLSEEDLNTYRDTGLRALQNIGLASLSALQQASGSLFRLFAWATGAAIIPVYLFYFLESNRNYTRDIQNQLTFLSPSLKEDIVFLIDEFIYILVSFFRGQLLIGLLMGILLALGFTLIGLKFGLILGLIIGLLNIVPYLGTIIGLASVLPIAFYQPDGGLPMLGLAILIFIIVQVIEGYLLTPKIMGKQTGLHPMAIIVSIFFWGVALEGILGMILAIPLTAFFIIAWRLMKKKYLPQFTGHGCELKA